MDFVLLLLGVVGWCVVAVILLVVVVSILESAKDWVDALIEKRREKKNRVEILEERVRELARIVGDLNQRLYDRTVIHNGAQYYHVQHETFREPDVYVKDLVNKIIAHLGLKITFLPGRGPDYFLEPEILEEVKEKRVRK